MGKIVWGQMLGALKEKVAAEVRWRKELNGENTRLKTYSRVAKGRL